MGQERGLERRLWRRIFRPACFADKQKLSETCIHIFYNERERELAWKAVDKHCTYYESCVETAAKKKERGKTKVAKSSEHQ